MKHILCHKDIEVLEFETLHGTISGVGELFSKEHLPVSVFPTRRGQTLEQNLHDWWRGRAIPASRQNLREALESLGNMSVEKLVEKSYGLSLSDHYWAKPLNSSLTWHEINFFENAFSEDVGKALFGNLGGDISAISLISPDNTSDGWLRKRWIIDAGERILIKGGSETFQQEPFNEVLASEICSRFGFDFVQYKVVKYGDTFYSACKDFVTTETELVSAWHVRSVLTRQNNVSRYTHLIEATKKLGMANTEKIEKSLCQMAILDSLMANTDRHFNNFGFLRNPDMLEWLGLAPIFDTGTSLFHQISTERLRSGFYKFYPQCDESKPFARTHHEQLKKLPCKKYAAEIDFSALDGLADWFDNLLKGKDVISDERRKLLCDSLRERIRKTQGDLI